DFTLAATPSSYSVTSDGVASYTVTVGSVNGFAGAVTFGVGGLPPGASTSFSPATVSGAGSTTLTVTTAGSPIGSSTLTITGTSGSLSHAPTATLVVTSAAVCSISGVISPA